MCFQDSNDGKIRVAAGGSIPAGEVAYGYIKTVPQGGSQSADHLIIPLQVGFVTLCERMRRKRHRNRVLLCYFLLL